MHDKILLLHFFGLWSVSFYDFIFDIIILFRLASMHSPWANLLP